MAARGLRRIGSDVWARLRVCRAVRLRSSRPDFRPTDPATSKLVRECGKQNLLCWLPESTEFWNFLIPAAARKTTKSSGAGLSPSPQLDAPDQFVESRVVAQGVETRVDLKISHPHLASLVGFFQIVKRFILIPLFGHLYTRQKKNGPGCIHKALWHARAKLPANPMFDMPSYKAVWFFRLFSLMCEIS